MILKLVVASIVLLVVGLYFVGRYLAKIFKDADENLHEPMYDNRYKKP